MKNIYAYILTAVFLLSCSDSFLEKTPAQSVADTEALTTFSDYTTAITGVYNNLSSANYYGRYGILIPDVMSDDVKQNVQANRVKDYAEYMVSVTDENAAAIWRLLYGTVNALNLIINNDVPITSSVEAQRDHFVGEAHALRGLVYFDLVRFFAQHYGYTTDASHAGVPIILTFDPEKKPARNTVKEVYAQIVSDFITAISLMSDNARSGNASTLSKTAVRALLARVYLNQHEWEKAEDVATEVINDSKYALVSNANYMHVWKNDFTTESLFEIAMTASDNLGANALANMYIREGFGDYLPSNDVISLFEAEDVRRGVFYEDEFLQGNYAPYRVGKYRNQLGLDNTKVIRLAEVYLIRAEARARIGTNVTGAQADYDKVHQRAIANADPITSTGNDLLEAILLERRLELCFEGQRLFDLVRNKKDIIRNDCTANTCIIAYGSDRVILPIPQAELSVNPNIKPNPGYN
jgi:hypothetical protein